MRKDIIIGAIVFIVMSVIGYHCAISENIESLSDEDLLYYDGRGVFVSDITNDVYVVGSKCRGTSETDRPVLWKNRI